MALFGTSDLEEILNSWETIEPGMEPQSCCWEDVMAAIETAKEAYAMKATNKGRVVLRNMATIKTLQALSQVVPEQDGLSVLRGGLTLVFKVLFWKWFPEPLINLLLELTD
jgi:hypothetical protein